MSAKGNITCYYFSSWVCLFEVFSPVILDVHPYALSGFWLFFWTSEHHFFEQSAVFRPNIVIFHFSCSNDKAFKWETVSQSLEHQVSSVHTQGCPLAQLTAFAALTDAVLVSCNSVASVTRTTELEQKSVCHETSSWRLSKIHQLFWFTEKSVLFSHYVSFLPLPTHTGVGLLGFFS